MAVPSARYRYHCSDCDSRLADGDRLCDARAWRYYLGVTPPAAGANDVCARYLLPPPDALLFVTRVNCHTAC